MTNKRPAVTATATTDDYSTSLTEPVTFIPRIRRPSSKAPSKSKRVKSRTLTQDDHERPLFPPLLSGDEPPVLMSMREQAYRSSRAFLDHVLEQATQYAFQTTVDAVTQFTRDAWTSATSASVSATKEIPTAVILSGINVSDNLVAFDMIERRLTTDLAHGAPVVVLASADLATIRQTLRAMIGKLTGDASDDVDDLVAWFAQQSPVPTAVPILLPELESCDLAVVSHLIRIMKRMGGDPARGGGKIPFVLILGISTLPDVLARGLDHQALNAIHTTSFQLSKAKDILDYLFRRLFIDPTSSQAEANTNGGGNGPHTLGLRFAASIIEFVVSRFHYSNLSVTEIGRALRYATMDFFFANPLSFLAPPSTRQAAMGAMTPDHWDLVRAVPSIRTEIRRLASATETDGPKIALDLLTSDVVLREHVEKWLDALDTYHLRHACAVDIVLRLQAHTRISKRSLAYVYQVALDSNLMLDVQVRLMLQLFRKLPYEMKVLRVPLRDLHGVLATVAAGLAHHGDSFAPELARIADFTAQIEALIIEERGSDSESSSDSDVSDDDHIGARMRDTTFNVFQSTARTPRSRKRTRSASEAATTSTDLDLTPGPDSTKRRALAILERQEEDRAWARRTGATGAITPAEKKRELTSVSGRTIRLAAEMCDWLQTTLEAWLVPPKTLVAHELLYQDRVLALDTTLTAQPRTSVQTALLRPEVFLNVAGSSSDTPFLEPDASILYKLHLECGRLINLFDWYTAFMTIIRRAPDFVDDEKVTFVRFIRAVAELQVLGFIKPTNRKTDHVQRLTWGNV
ncbi:Origin recognition complex subunit 3 [Allomyces arbusculus]|nr:Origin recognition complex subunit 3 [Allomyces arbusculus]